MKRVRINNQIVANEIRVIDNEGKNLGVMKPVEAINLAKERELDLIEISPNASPPIAKIMDYGKFLYKEKKKARSAAKKVHEIETKDIRIHLGTSEHDLTLKAKKGTEFLKDGHRLRIDLFLRGREKYLDREFLKGRLKRVLGYISENYKVAEDAKKGPRGLYMIIEKS